MGNIHSIPSADRPEDGPDDFSATRGREFEVNSEKVGLKRHRLFVLLMFVKGL